MNTMSSYFDYAAATPLSSMALKAMQPFLGEQFYNPSALYLKALKVRDEIEKARTDIATVLGVRSNEIIFTAGGTEADNLAIQGVMNQFPDVNCIVSAIEHEAILETAQQFHHKIAPVKTDGTINIEALKKLINDKTVLVSIMVANNEIGTVQSLSGIAKVLHEIRWQRTKSGNKLPLYFHTDASQAPNYLNLRGSIRNLDLMSLNAGKIYGPKETGALFVRTGVQLAPLIRGGGQERGLRSGTQNVANIVGFAAALKEAEAMRIPESKRMGQLQLTAIKFLLEKLPEVIINGGLGMRLPNNLHITIPGADNERLMMELDEQGFMVATGSACSASSDEPSHVLKAIGLSDEAARSSLRITMGRDTTEKSVLALLSAITELVT
jgi:cysteine desulfurase